MKFSGERFVPNATDKDMSVEHLQRYYSVASLVKDKVVVDAASGEGYGTVILSEHAAHVTGLDISAEAIVHAKLTYVRDNISFVQGSIETLPFPDKSVDVVVSFETIEHVSEEIQRQFLAEIKRILKHDGLLIMSTPDKFVYSDWANYSNPFHVKEFYKEDYHEFLSGYFKYVDIYHQKFEVTSVILNNLSNQAKRVHIDNNDHITNGKYLIAVCGNQPLQGIDLNSFVPDHQDKMNHIVQRIISLQDEVEERNKHIKHLDGIISSKDHLIALNQEKLQFIQEQAKQQVEYQSQQVQQMQHAQEQIQQQYKLSSQALDIVHSMEGQLKESSEKLLDALVKIAVQQEEINRLDTELKTTTLELQTAHNDLNAAAEDLQEAYDELNATKVELQMAKQEMSAVSEEMYTQNDIISSIKDIHEDINHKWNEHANLVGQGFLDKEQVIQNQIAHIDQLLEQERKLNNILHSGGWNVLSRYYKYRDMLLPDNSKRKLLAKLTYRTLKNPSQILKKLNKNNIKKLKYYLKTEDPGLVESRIDNYLERHSSDNNSPESLQLFQDIDTTKEMVFPVVDKPIVSIIIPVYNQWHYTYACLNSILDNTTDASYEVIVADDMSKDETVNITDYVKNIKVVRDGTNRGFLLNCNNAAQYAKGKYIFFLNNDTNVQPEWLSSLVDLIEKDESIGMVGSKLVYPDGRQQEAGGIIWNDASGWNYGRLDDPSKPEYNYVKEVDYISGAAIMIRHDLWKQIGGFDERYVPAYYEDTDLAFEVRKHGYKVMFQPQSVIVHFEGISHGKDENTGIKSYQVKNKLKFVEKWKDELGNHLENAQDVFWARDRSYGKPTIVVVDHYVPHYDRDAGGRCTNYYLKLFVELGYHVIFIGDNFFKHEPYTTELQQLGIEVLYGDWYYNHIESWIKSNGKYFDFVYLNRPHISIKYIDIFRKYTEAKIIYFGHDLHYLRELRNYELDGNPELLKSSQYWKDIEFELFRKSDIIHVVGTYEQETLVQEFSNKIIRNIPLYIFDQLSADKPGFSEREHLMFVGGFNHKPNYDGVKWFLKDIFHLIKQNNPEIKLYIVGSNPPDDMKQLASEDIIVTGYVTDEELNNYYNKCKLVVVPLRFGAGVKGKVVEALSQQVPIVTTAIGAEGLSEINQCAEIKNDPEELASSIVELYNDPKKWTELSFASKDFINNNFSKKAARTIILQDFTVRR